MHTLAVFDIKVRPCNRQMHDSKEMHVLALFISAHQVILRPLVRPSIKSRARRLACSLAA